METKRDEKRAALIQLGLPEAVRRIFDGEEVHPELRYRAESPYHSLTEGSGLVPEFIPFWECGVTISGYHPREGVFVICSLECLPDVFARFPHFAQLVASLLIDLWEDETSVEDLIQIGTLFGLAAADITWLMAQLEAGCPKEHETWRQMLLPRFAKS